jgi:hypothetical protein
MSRGAGVAFQGRPTAVIVLTGRRIPDVADSARTAGVDAVWEGDWNDELIALLRERLAPASTPRGGARD